MQHKRMGRWGRERAGMVRKEIGKEEMGWKKKGGVDERKNRGGFDEGEVKGKKIENIGS